MTEVSSLIESAFASLIEAADDRTRDFAAQLNASQQVGLCPRCSAADQALDFDASLTRSVERNEKILIYQACVGCVAKAQELERLARMGVPSRVRHATLDNYSVSQPEQEKAMVKVRDWVTDSGKLNLVLLGNPGTGKGHIAAAVVKMLGRAARWISHSELVGDYHAEEFSARPRLIKRWQTVPVLVIDEMGGKSMTTDTPEIFYSIINEREDKGLVTLFLGNIPYRAKKEGHPSILAIIGADRTESRFFAPTTVVACRWDDYRKSAAFAASTKRAF